MAILFKILQSARCLLTKPDFRLILVINGKPFEKGD